MKTIELCHPSAPENWPGGNSVIAQMKKKFHFGNRRNSFVFLR